MAKTPVEVEIPEHYGTQGADVMQEQSGILYGLGGNDLFVASAHDGTWLPAAQRYVYTEEYFYGGSGSDTVSYLASAERIEASLETGVVNRMFGAYVQSTDYLDSIENLIGSAYADFLYGNGSANNLNGGNGNDTLSGYGGNDQLFGDAGNDLVDGGNGNDMLDGGTGNDALLGGSGNDTLAGANGNDHLEGGSGNDTLNGGAGNDALIGGDGTDTADYTGGGAVMVNLWLGNATGAWGSDTLSSIERVETGNGNDIVYGGFDSNRLTTGGGNDTVYAFDGHDTVYAGAGNDIVDGYEGNDILYAGSGNDRVNGGADGDTLYGEGGNDVLEGDGGDDLLLGDTGSDRLRGGDGLDILNAGSGADVIIWGEGDSGADTIAGFNLAEDRLHFESDFFDVEPVGSIDLRDVLMVFDDGADAILAANTKEEGWTVIAQFENVDAYQLGQMITSESILASTVAPIGGGAAGDVVI